MSSGLAHPTPFMGQRRAATNLPVELLEHILDQSELTFRDVLRCKLVNRRLQDVISRSLPLRYKVELGAYGMVDGTPEMRARTSTVYRMKQLQACQESWNRFQWTSQRTLTFPSWPISLLDGDLLAMLEGEDLKLLRMPSKFRNLEEDEKVLHELALDDLYIDKALRLLVSIKRDPTDEPAFSAALLHLDTGKAHPAAAIPTLVQSLTSKRTEGWSFAMSVTGPYLAVLFQNFTADYDAEDWSTRTDWNEQEDTLVVWNWHTGERMMASPTIKCCCIRSFIFLDFGRILVGHITPAPSREPLLRVIKVKDGDVEVSLQDADHTFHFPPILIPVLAADVNIHCEPTPTWCPGEDEETLFSVAPEHRIVVITLRATQDNIFNSDSYTIVVLFHDLMSHVKPRNSPEWLCPLKNHTPWPKWGGKTRLFYPTSAHGCSDLLSVYGTRFISIPLERSRTMEIIDFNPHIIRRRLSTQAEAEADRGTEVGSSPAPGIDMLAPWYYAMALPSRESLGDGMLLGNKPDATSDPKHNERESRSLIVAREPLQVPIWIPTEAAQRCHLPYTSYEIPIPMDLNMDFCIDVMMGQDTIVFMFDNEAGDEYTWTILSF
ncbi:hypothetical protein BJ322DRAFT_1112757 [Thelephora terrestris]|uniref:F-box domain-containing protein n=1 Tax=Thelephora terrestris TaxID=56493 RepID=A0A9P6H656_9AGAM|nr:hypothetical protein BJ322DRAFT_1112757 [Thelephora terrestris]